MPLSDSATPDQIAAYLVQQGISQESLQSSLQTAIRAQQINAVKALFVTTPSSIFSDSDWQVLKVAMLAPPVCTDIYGLLRDAMTAAAVDDQHRFAAAALMIMQVLNGDSLARVQPGM